MALDSADPRQICSRAALDSPPRLFADFLLILFLQEGVLKAQTMVAVDVIGITLSLSAVLPEANILWSPLVSLFRSNCRSRLAIVLHISRRSLESGVHTKLMMI